MKEKLAKYINYYMESINYEKKIAKVSRHNMMESCLADAADINQYIDDKKNENSFQKLLFSYIDKYNLRDSDVYNNVHIDRRLFSKIRSDEGYHPSKETVILLGFSLKLSLDEMIDLLNSASYSLPMNNYYDLIIRFCFEEKIYKLTDVNELLSMYNCKLFNY